MSQLSWREAARVTVPAAPGLLWTPALDYLRTGRLYKLQVGPAPSGPQTWTPASAASPCQADGDAGLSRSSEPFIAGAPVGALIAKIGGSTADTQLDPAAILFFSVGRHCVFKAPEEAKLGALFLGVNDTSASAALLTGQLEVTVWEAL